MQITVTAVYALRDKQHEVSLRLEQGATVGDAMARLRSHPECQGWQVDVSALGVFGRVRPRDWALVEGERLECCRLLQTDPRTARRLRATAKNKR